LRKYFIESVDELIELGEAALGLRKSTLAITNVNIVDVYTGTINEGTILIYKDRVVGIVNGSFKAQKIFDGGGKYAIPGLMDAHMHIESTMLLPTELSKLLIPHGVTSIFADPHEIANVLGVRGIKLLLELANKSLVRVFIEVPSRVPTAPQLEDTGSSLGINETLDLLSLDNSVSLGELNYQNVLGENKTFYLEKILLADYLGKIVNGHMAGVSTETLNVLGSLGLLDDHETLDCFEAVERLKRGIAVMVREGSTERNLENIIKDIIKIPDKRKILMCTDDKHPKDILYEGHIDYSVRKAIELGMDPIEAIQTATINIAQHFGIDSYVGAIAPLRKADIVLVNSLEELSISNVFFDGKHVFAYGKLLVELPKPNIPKWTLKTIKISKELRSEDLVLKAPISEGSVKVRVMGVVEDQIVVKELSYWLSVKDGFILPDLENDVLHIAVVERHRGLKSVGKAFVKGFGLKKGAIASSVAHDHHNIVVVGVNAEEMYAAVKYLEKYGGGFVVVENRSLRAIVDLPFAGLLSLDTAEEVIEKLEKANVEARRLGCKLKSPFMQLEFITLPTVPELGLTNKGLVDSRNYRVIDPIIEYK